MRLISKTWLLFVIVNSMSAKAQSSAAAAVVAKHETRIQKLKEHFDQNGDWKGTSPEREVRWLSGVNLQGLDYQSTALQAGQGQEDCAHLCKVDVTCAAFTFVPRSGQDGASVCWLKSGVPAAVANGSVVSGIVRPER
jgi:hypothetical protein